MLNYEIQNFAPDMDVITISVFDKKTQEWCRIEVSKDMDGKTHIMINDCDTNKCDMILGEKSETYKL